MELIRDLNQRFQDDIPLHSKTTKKDKKTIKKKKTQESKKDDQTDVAVTKA